jgi:hypothetical protein
VESVREESFGSPFERVFVAGLSLIAAIILVFLAV